MRTRLLAQEEEEGNNGGKGKKRRWHFPPKFRSMALQFHSVERFWIKRNIMVKIFAILSPPSSWPSERRWTNARTRRHFRLRPSSRNVRTFVRYSISWLVGFAFREMNSFVKVRIDYTVLDRCDYLWVLYHVLTVPPHIITP